MRLKFTSLFRLSRRKSVAFAIGVTIASVPALQADSQHESAQGANKGDIQSPVQGEAQDCVILLHGLLRSSKSMTKLTGVLQEANYYVVNQDYPSRTQQVEQLAAKAVSEALSQCSAEQKVNFVTHSLGGILVRHYLSENKIANLGRVVMLAPPNQGSEVPDKLGDVPGFDLINGPAGAQLGTNSGGMPRSLGPADFDVGIIAGRHSVNLVLSGLIPEKDDGKVSIENTKLEGMKDHIVLPVSHPFIMSDKEAMTQVVHYLSFGKFDHEDEKTQSPLTSTP